MESVISRYLIVYITKQNQLLLNVKKKESNNKLITIKENEHFMQTDSCCLKFVLRYFNEITFLNNDFR